MWTISLPLQVAVSKNKNFSLNLNQYRNAHFHTLNRAKEEFTELAVDLIKKVGIPKLAQVSLEYIVYPGTRQLCDVNNICSVVDKFFSDSLVHAGVLSDDNYTILADSRFRFGRIDRENPRVDVIIRRKESEQENMKISTVIVLTPSDLNTAIREFMVKRNVTIPEGEFSFTLDNGSSGYQVRFEKADDQATQEPVKPGRKQKMEPKAAMEKLNETLASYKAPEVPAVTTTPAAETVAQATPVVPTEKAVEALPVAPEAAKAVPVEAAKAEAPVAEPEVVPPAPPKTSLFASFKRPSNG
jgi:hypothetical protein